MALHKEWQGSWSLITSLIPKDTLILRKRYREVTMNRRQWNYLSAVLCIAWWWFKKYLKGSVPLADTMLTITGLQLGKWIFSPPLILKKKKGKNHTKNTLLLSSFSLYIWLMVAGREGRSSVPCFHLLPPSLPQESRYEVGSLMETVQYLTT